MKTTTKLDPKTGVNSLSLQQLDQIIDYAFTHKISSGPLSGRPMLQVVGPPTPFGTSPLFYITNFKASPYPRIHIPNKIWDSWDDKPLTKDLLFHLVFWRWINGGILCPLD